MHSSIHYVEELCSYTPPDILREQTVNARNMCQTNTTHSEYSSQQTRQLITKNDHGSMAYVVPCIIAFILICVDLFFKSYINIKSYYFTIPVTFLLLIKVCTDCTVVTDRKARLSIKFLPSPSNRDVLLKLTTAVAGCEGNLWNSDCKKEWERLTWGLLAETPLCAFEIFSLSETWLLKLFPAHYR